MYSSSVCVDSENQAELHHMKRLLTPRQLALSLRVSETACMLSNPAVCRAGFVKNAETKRLQAPSDSRVIPQGKFFRMWVQIDLISQVGNVQDADVVPQ